MGSLAVGIYRCRLCSREFLTERVKDIPEISGDGWSWPFSLYMPCQKCTGRIKGLADLIGIGEPDGDREEEEQFG